MRLGIFEVALVSLLATACEDAAVRERSVRATGGDPERGRDALRDHGCGACHTIPGVPGANALVGPPLDHIAKRSYVAGMLPNTPANLRLWIMRPQEVKPHNAMPDVGVSEAAARDMSAYLYTLE